MLRNANLPVTSSHDCGLTAERARLLCAALLAARDAGKAIMEVYDSDFSVSLKDDKSPLTLADRRAHDIIVRHLTASKLTRHLGQLPVLSEEGKDIAYNERRHWECFWLVDPLDGTKEFVKRNGEFTVNIALVHRERPILGIVHAPVRDVFYFSVEGRGAYRLDESRVFDDLSADASHVTEQSMSWDELLKVSRRLSQVKASPDQSRTMTVVGSRSHATEELERFVESLQARYGQVNLIPAGSSLKFCLVAEGSADVYPRFGPTMEWDTAAGQAVVEQAGGKVISAENKLPLSYNKESLLNPWFIVTNNLSDTSDVLSYR